MISREDIKKLASLARIKLSTEEEDSLAKDMDNILGYVQQIQEVSGSVETSTKEYNRNIFRDDEHPIESGSNTDTLLTEAPERKENYVKVKNIL